MLKIAHKETNCFMQRFLKQLLNEYGYESIVAETDDELFEALKSDTIALVIYDITELFDSIKELGLQGHRDNINFFLERVGAMLEVN